MFKSLTDHSLHYSTQRQEILDEQNNNKTGSNISEGNCLVGFFKVYENFTIDYLRKLLKRYVITADVRFQVFLSIQT